MAAERSRLFISINAPHYILGSCKGVLIYLANCKMVHNNSIALVDGFAG